MRCLEAADSNIYPLASQYSPIDHGTSVERVMPAARRRGASFVVASALNSGFVAGARRYNYGDTNTLILDDKREKLERLRAITSCYGVDPVAAALQFGRAPDVVATLIVGTTEPAYILAITPPLGPKSLRRSGPNCEAQASFTPMPLFLRREAPALDAQTLA